MGLRGCVVAMSQLLSVLSTPDYGLGGFCKRRATVTVWCSFESLVARGFVVEQTQGRQPELSQQTCLVGCYH